MFFLEVEIQHNFFHFISEVLSTKFPDISGKEIASQLSRWFSGAKDREGGKRERLNRKHQC